MTNWQKDKVEKVKGTSLNMFGKVADLSHMVSDFKLNTKRSHSINLVKIPNGGVIISCEGSTFFPKVYRMGIWQFEIDVTWKLILHGGDLFKSQ